MAVVLTDAGIKAMPKRKPKQPVDRGVFTDEDYAYLGRVVADAYTHALRRREAATESDGASDERETRSVQRLVRVLDENGCRNAVAEWVEKSTYRILIHRHDGTFTAADESERKYMQADTIPLLADALMNWPEGAAELPPTRYVRVPEHPNGEVSDAGPLTSELKPKREPGIR